MNKNCSENSILKDPTWRESISGTWLTVISPTLTVLFSVFEDTIKIPRWLGGVAIAAMWMGGFLLLVRAQFALRKQNADVFKAFGRSTIIGFALVAAILFFMYLNRGGR